MNRSEAVAAVLAMLDERDYLVTTTGLISREVFAQCDRPRNFYMLGSMGLASSLALGLALLRPGSRFLVLEGDGSALMSLGTLPLAGFERPANLTHVILDNEAYESTGGQRSISGDIDFTGIAQASGYARADTVHTSATLQAALRASTSGPSLVVAKVVIDPTLRTPPRVTLTPQQIRDRFQAALAADAAQNEY